MLNPKKTLLYLVLLFLLTGCYSKPPVPLASPNEDQLAKTFQTSIDQSSLYIVREKRHVGHLQNFSFIVDNKVIGELENGSFALLELPPGEHVIKALGKWQNHDEIIFTVDTEKGEIYFVNMYPTMGSWQAVINYELLDKVKGKKLVVQYRRVKTSIKSSK